MEQDELLKCRWAYKDTNNDYLYEQFDLLHCVHDIISNLKASFNDNNEVILDFDIINENIKPTHTQQLEKRCPTK